MEREKRQELFDTMKVNQHIVNADGKILVHNVPYRVALRVEKMVGNKDRYNSVSHQFSSPYLKWWVVSVIHEMEAEQDFSKYLGNGQALNKKTTIVPAGRGPFSSWEEGAIDALKLQRADDLPDDSIGSLLYFLEGFNGYGYSKYHNMNSPYLFSGSDKYIKGKYVQDGKWDENSVSQQIGIALLIKRLMDIGEIK